MSVELIIGTAFRFNTSLEALAALGARLRLLADDEPGHPAVTPLLDRAVEAMGLGQALQTLSPEQARVLADGIRAFFLQAADLLECPQLDPAIQPHGGDVATCQCHRWWEWIDSHDANRGPLLAGRDGLRCDAGADIEEAGIRSGQGFGQPI